MLTPEDEALLGEPDAVLLSTESSAKLDEFLSSFTIPINFFRGPVAPATWAGIGTGVLLNLEEHVFALTAGHVVRDYEAASACVVGIAREPSCFETRFSRRAYRASSYADFGFLEIPPAARASYRAHDRFPMKAERVLVTTPDELIAADDWMVLSGYPDEVTVKDGRGLGTRLFTYSTTVAGQGEAPPSRFPRPPTDIRVLDLWVSLRRQVQSFPELASDVRVPLFAGASGGGCWKSGVRPERAGFDPQRMRLVAIHAHSTESAMIDGEPTRFAREILIGHHLRLIADHVPEVRDSVLRRWPALEDDSWGAL